MKLLANKITKRFVFISIIAVSASYVSQSGDFDYYLDEFMQGYNMEDDNEFDNVIIQYADGSEYRSSKTKKATPQNTVNLNDRTQQTPRNNYQQPRNIVNPTKSGRFIRSNLKKESVNYKQGFNKNQRELMTIATCIQPADRIVASAFMLPPGWQAQCQTQYSVVMNTLWANPMFNVRNANNSIQISSDKGQHYYYDAQMRQQMLQSKSMQGVDTSIFGRDFEYMLQNNTQEFMKQWDLAYPQAIDLVQFANYRSQEIPQLNGYQVYHISRDPIANTISQILKNYQVKVNVVTIVAQQRNNPNNIKMLKIIQAIIPGSRNDQYTWHTMPYIATGTKNDAQEMSKMIDLIINTSQENPVFSQMVAKINIKMSKQARQSIANISNITSNTYDEINQIYSNTYKNTQASSDRMQSNWVDGMLEVENYTNPFDGKTEKMPMHNKYYYTNNLDDYIGTNNPLFDPNVDLNYLYNWRKLERI